MKVPIVIEIPLDELLPYPLGSMKKIQKEADCDFCLRQKLVIPAICDAKTVFGPWANVCKDHLHYIDMAYAKAGYRFI